MRYLVLLFAFSLFGDNLTFKFISLKERSVVDEVFSFFIRGSISEKQKVKSSRQDSLPQREKLECQFGRLSYDLNMSPYAGGETLLFGTEVVEMGTKSLNINQGEKFSAFGFRAIELALLYFPLNFFTSTVQHEVFGHGYRIRDINRGVFSKVSYSFDFPPPYGSGGATTFYQFAPKKITLSELTAFSIAGIEAQNILAQVTSFHWLSSKKIDPRQVALYLISRYALNFYPQNEFFSQSNDLDLYISTLNYTYTQGRVSFSELKKLAWINLADIFTYYSGYAYFRYLFTGKETPLPWKNLASARLGITPFGPEYILDQYVTRDHPIHFYLKGARHAKNNFWGLGILAPFAIVKNGWSFGGKFDFWRQPKLLLEQGRYPIYRIASESRRLSLYSLSDQHKMRCGLAASIFLRYQKNAGLGLELEIGGKTRGFLPGYSLYKAPVFRASYLASF